MSTPRFLDLPAGVERRDVATPRGTFAALEARPGGPPTGMALLVPGWTGSKEDFLAVLAPVAAAGYHALTYDQRGQHDTAGADDPAAYALEALASDALAVASTVTAAPVHLLGHSFGGLVARTAALGQPAALRSLTLLCSGPGALPAEKHELLLTMARAIDSHGLAATWTAKRAHDLSQPGAMAADAEIEAFLQRRFLRNSPVGLREITLHLTSAEDRAAELVATGLPVHVCYGDLDDGWPPAVQAEMARRTGAAVSVLPGTGHSPAVEAADVTAGVLVDFWRQVDAGAPAGNR